MALASDGLTTPPSHWTSRPVATMAEASSECFAGRGFRVFRKAATPGPLTRNGSGDFYDVEEVTMAAKKRRTKDDVATLTEALKRLGINNIQGDAQDALRRLQRDANRAEKMAKILRGMFDDGVLDPYPTGDTAAEYKLRALSGWRK